MVIRSIAPRALLVVDVGGTHVKVLKQGRSAVLKIASGPKMTPTEMVRAVRKATAAWRYRAVSIGYPGVVADGRIVGEPPNLGPGWVGFRFDRAFERPVRIINDAAMQALGAYRGGRMLYLGFGTGLGSALLVDGIVVPMELGHLPYRHGRSFEDYVGAAGLARLGRGRWERHVHRVVKLLGIAVEVSDVVIGGGNAARLATVPRGARRGAEGHALAGGLRLWSLSGAPRAALRLRPSRSRP